MLHTTKETTGLTDGTQKVREGGFLALDGHGLLTTGVAGVVFSGVHGTAPDRQGERRDANRGSGRADSEESSPGPHSTGRAAIEGEERILIVDDEEILLEMQQRAIQNLGYCVETCTNCIEALKLFAGRPHSFDLVMTDYCMPQMTGIDFAKELMGIRPDIPVILSSGYIGMAAERNALEAGIRALLLKPLTIRATVETIRRVLDESGRG